MWRLPRLPARRRARGAGRGKSQAGFTLLELMVSLSILSFIVAGLYMSVGASAIHARRLGRRLEIQQAARHALQRISADLESAFAPPTGDEAVFEGKKRESEAGQSDTLRFHAVLFPWDRRGRRSADLVSIDYALSPETKEEAPGKKAAGMSLLRRKARLQGAEAAHPPAPVVILEGVRELAFEYLDSKGAKHDNWSAGGEEGQKFLPAAVRVTIILEGGKEGDEEGGGAVSALIALPLGLRPPEEGAQAAAFPGAGGEGAESPAAGQPVGAGSPSGAGAPPVVSPPPSVGSPLRSGPIPAPGGGS